MWIYRLARLNTKASKPTYHRVSSNTGIDGLHVSGWPLKSCKQPNRFNTPLAHVSAVHRARMPRRHVLVQGETGGKGQRNQNTPEHKKAEPRKVSPLVSDFRYTGGYSRGGNEVVEFRRGSAAFLVRLLARLLCLALLLRVGHVQVKSDRLPDVEHPRLGRVDCVHHHLHDDVDEHGDKRQSKQQVDERRHEALRVLGQDVAEADRADGDEDEVERLQIRPFLPLNEHRSPEHDVQGGDDHGDDRRQVELVVYDEPVGFGFAFVFAASAHGTNDLAAAARVVEASHERPEELEDAREQSAEVCHDDEAQRNADECVDDRRHSSRLRHRREVTVACGQKKDLERNSSLHSTVTWPKTVVSSLKSVVGMKIWLNFISILKHM